MGADDVARPRRLELQLSALEQEGLDACGGGVRYFPSATSGLRRYGRWLNSLTTVEATRRDVLLDAGVEVAAFVDVDERKIGKRISGIPVLSHHEGPRDGVVLGAVAGQAARGRLRELAHEQGRCEGDDFIAVA
jgi:hypothetical protein